MVAMVPKIDELAWIFFRVMGRRAPINTPS
jgi:hypothetical protein